MPNLVVAMALVSGVLNNHEAYQRWIRTTHARAQFVNTTLSMADMLKEDSVPAEILKSEKNIAMVHAAFGSYMSPFNVDDKERLVVSSFICQQIG